MLMRGELSMRATRASSTSEQQGAESKLFVAALVLVLILLAVASIIFAPAPSDPFPIEAAWLIGP